MWLWILYNANCVQDAPGTRASGTPHASKMRQRILLTTFWNYEQQNCLKPLFSFSTTNSQRCIRNNIVLRTDGFHAVIQFYLKYMYVWMPNAECLKTEQNRVIRLHFKWHIIININITSQRIYHFPIILCILSHLFFLLLLLCKPCRNELGAAAVFVNFTVPLHIQTSSAVVSSNFM